MDDPRIVILGAGPIGLEATLYARYLGYKTHLLERAGSPAANVQRWGHVTLFSPFGMNASPLGVAALQAQDPSWHRPAADEMLTGSEMFHRYWKPLAESDLVAGVLRCDTEVVSISRRDWLKHEGVNASERGEAPLRVLGRHSDGTEVEFEAEVVLDCTGTYGNHNWLGQGGGPALGELTAAEQIEYGLPEVLAADRSRYLDKRTLVVGAGYSAATTVTQLAQLATERQNLKTQVTWITRGDAAEPIARIADDRLPSRDALAAQANELAGGQYECVQHHPATAISQVKYRPESDDFEVELTGALSGTHVFDRIVANVGYHPERRIYSELQVHECYATEGPMKLAALLAAEQRGGPVDCLSQTPHGPASLVCPEPNFYLLGAKSYGRGSQFLLSIGLQQIRDVFTIVGEREDLDLYATMPALV